MRSYAGFSLLLLLTACGSVVTPPPQNIDNACAIVQERPGWYKSMQAVEAKWQVPVHVQLAVIYQESKFKGQARTPLSFKLDVIPMGRNSSAYGYAQAIDSTWNWYRDDTGYRGAKRDNFADSVDFMGWYMDQSNKRLGIRKTDARRQYLAYHDGHAGYKRRTFRHKRWLLRIAKQVGARAKLYKTQLSECAKTS